VIAIVILMVLVAVVLAAALWIAAARVDVATSSSGALGAFFVSPGMSARPRGVQEEELPRFVFRDRVASPATASAPVFGSAAPVPC
jgi:type IV secretory pathway protease TraF